MNRPDKIVTLLMAIIIAVAFCGCKKDEEITPSDQMVQLEEMKIQEPLVAGRFYPEDPQALREMISLFFEKVPDVPMGSNLMGVISPHAGYIYSGQVAAHIYRNLPKNVFREVVIIFPSHFAQFRGVLALDVDAYKTPLGLANIDRKSIKALIDSDPAVFYKEGMYRKEHSGEVMIPFIQAALGEDVKIIPLMMGDQTPRMAQRLAESLHKLFGDRKVLYIASSDMSHYHPYDEANAIDSRALTHIINLDDLALFEDLRTGKTELCGYGPVFTLMHLAKLKGGGKVRVLEHANSGDSQGDKSKVVGYASVAIFPRNKPGEQAP